MLPHIFLINLDRSPDRLARCAQVLQALGLNWERVPAVDGATLGAAELARLNPYPSPHGEWFRPLTPGEIGCFLSHLACWRLAAERGLACCLILEDDFVAESSFTVDQLQALADSCSRWDVIKLTQNGKPTPDMITLDVGLRLQRCDQRPGDCCAYMVSLPGARKLITQREHLYRPVDFDMKHHWERGLNIFVVVPNPFRQSSPQEAASIIGGRKDYRDYPLLKKLGVYLRKHRYHTQYWIAERLKLGRVRLS